MAPQGGGTEAVFPVTWRSWLALGFEVTLARSSAEPFLHLWKVDSHGIPASGHLEGSQQNVPHGRGPKDKSKDATFSSDQIVEPPASVPRASPSGTPGPCWRPPTTDSRSLKDGRDVNVSFFHPDGAGDGGAAETPGGPCEALWPTHSLPWGFHTSEPDSQHQPHVHVTVTVTVTVTGVSTEMLLAHRRAKINFLSSCATEAD